MKIELTQAEARELLSVADNGFGDGDWFRSGYCRHKASQRALLRAMQKLSRAANQDPSFWEFEEGL